MDWVKIFTLVASCLAVCASGLAVALQLYSIRLKRKETTLQSYQKSQIEKLQELYGWLVELNFINQSLFYNQDIIWDYDSYFKKLQQWRKVFLHSRTFFLKNNILFTTELNKELHEIFGRMRIVGLAISEELDKLKEDDERTHGQMYDDYEDEKLSIKKYVQKLRESNQKVESFGKVIEKVDDMFRKLVK